MGKALKRWWPLFMLPTCLAFMIGFVIPFIQGFYLSFCQFITINNTHFVGIENYVRALSDPQFSTSFFFTVAFAFLSTVLINVIALAIAQALTRKALKGTNIFRTIFFMPNLIGGIVLGYIWQILINCLLSNVGAQLIALNSAAGFWGLIILTLWQQVGYMMIIYIAGLQSIPSDYIEAAKVDGATEWIDRRRPQRGKARAFACGRDRISRSGGTTAIRSARPTRAAGCPKQKDAPAKTKTHAQPAQFPMRMETPLDYDLPHFPPIPASKEEQTLSGAKSAPSMPSRDDLRPSDGRCPDFGGS